MIDNIEESVITRYGKENELGEEEAQEQRHQAAEQLILQTVQHAESQGGITAWAIALETRIDRDMVDEIMKELIMARKVRLSRRNVSVFYLPYRELPIVKGWPRKVTAPAQQSRTRIVIKELPKDGGFSAICPECNRALRCSKKGNLVNNIRNHLIRRHGYTEESFRERLIGDGLIGAAKSPAALRVTDRAVEELT